MQLFLVRKYKWAFLLGLLISSFPHSAHSEEYYLEPVIQGYSADEVFPVIKENGVYYIAIEQMAEILQLKLSSSNGLQGAFLGKDYNINLQSLSSSSYKYINGQYLFDLLFYEKLFDLKLEVNSFDMQLQVTSSQDLPLVQKLKSQQRRESFIPPSAPDTFANYEFDNRWWSAPVIDFTYGTNYAVQDYKGDNEQHYNNDYYQVDMGMLAGGFDTYASFFGDKEGGNYDPRARITVGRTFLDEPKNALNLTTFEAGDVTAFNSTLFNNSVGGRGAYASSFKDLVLSADKTIDINGPLSQGWDVELYLNDQLIGFRQSGINGRYQFANIPVNYGLNNFKLMFYGPYGEIQTEERKYYSGTSPVKTGEFGYTFNAYQKDHYLFEKNEPYINPSNKATLDYTGYYGINDNMTLITGLTETPNVVTDETMDLGTAGMQFIFDGASFQYNSMFNLDTDELGHHFDVQGDVFLGTIFARYDDYGGIESPISYYNDEYLDDLAEIRLSGFLPFASLPYYLSYQEGNYESGNKFQEVHFRLSPNFMQYYNFTIENIWSKDQYETSNDVVLLLQAQYDKLGLHSEVRYQTEPENYLERLSQQVDYRWNKNTYFQANWDHDCRSQYSEEKDLDTLSVSVGRLFPFGGITLSVSADTDKDAYVSLTYNMSFGKVPGSPRVFTNAQTQMSERSAIYAKAVDENNNPIKGTRLQVSGLQDPVETDENGEVLIADIEPYQKTVLSVDATSLDDLALTPEFDSKKLVLRPGTVLPLTVPFAHKGALEGAIAGKEDLFKYKIVLRDSKGQTVATKTPEPDGSFIFDDVSYGDYHLLVIDETQKELKDQSIQINKEFYVLPLSIAI